MRKDDRELLLDPDGPDAAAALIASRVESIAVPPGLDVPQKDRGQQGGPV